jgi:predicted enzyme related to lactoylglutathione lyase
MVSRVWYTTVYVRDFARAMDFYENALGLKLRHRDDKFGHGAFATDGALFSVQRVEGKQSSMAGRQTGIGFGAADLDTECRRLSALGVKFTMKPERQPWGGYLSMFADPEGNVFYLDELKKER